MSGEQSAPSTKHQAPSTKHQAPSTKHIPTGFPPDIRFASVSHLRYKWAIMASVADLRREYGRYGLVEESMEKSPVDQFRIWFEQALSANVVEPNAMTLATADVTGQPSARIVLLKGFDESGFVFFTNYQSAKGRELLENPLAALVFFWAELERQVRINGEVEKTSDDESEAYFRTRPRLSQLGAHVSRQGRVIANRAELEQRMAAVSQEFEGMDVPRPENWGGFRVAPRTVEFWQGRPGRLHDRIRYVRQDGSWRLERLAP